MKQHQVDALRKKFYSLVSKDINLCKTSLKTKSSKDLQQNIRLIDIKCSIISSLVYEDFYAPSLFIRYARNIREDRKEYENAAIAPETRKLLNRISDFLVKFSRSLEKIDHKNHETVCSLLHSNMGFGGTSAIFDQSAYVCSQLI